MLERKVLDNKCNEGNIIVFLSAKTPWSVSQSVQETHLDDPFRKRQADWRVSLENYQTIGTLSFKNSH